MARLSRVMTKDAISERIAEVLQGFEDGDGGMRLDVQQALDLQSILTDEVYEVISNFDTEDIFEADIPEGYSEVYDSLDEDGEAKE